MKKLMIAAAVAFSLAGCATPSAPSPPGFPPTHADVFRTADEKAMIALEGSWRVTLEAVGAAVDSGALKGDRARQASVLLTRAKQGVDAARAAYRAGDGVQAAARLTDVAAALSGVRALLGR